jgi:hypothetical protein
VGGDEHRSEVGEVARARGDLRSEHDLVLGHDSLRVVALHELLVAHHHLRVGIGQVDRPVRSRRRLTQHSLGKPPAGAVCCGPAPLLPSVLATANGVEILSQPLTGIP